MILSALWRFQKKRPQGRNPIASNRNYFYLTYFCGKSGKQGKDLHLQAPKTDLKKMVQIFRIVNSGLFMA